MTSCSAPVDCSVLVDIHGFKEYTQLIRNETGFNATLLRFCQNEICGALWGVGNPDVSGIGVGESSLIKVYI